MLKRISAISAAVAGALLIGTGAQAASEGRLVCDRPLSSSTPANCVWQASGVPAERVSVVTSSSGEPVMSRSGSASAPVSSSERVLIVSEPASAGAPVYIIEPAAGSRFQRGDQVVIVTEPAIVESPRVIESSRGDAFPDPSPPSAIVEPRRERYDRQLDPSDTRDRALGRHSQPE
jgi:hypothetical protein